MCVLGDRQDGGPCPANYRDDSSFWFNLPANFDLLQACVREHLGTGDRTYVDDPAFRYFYEATVSWYIQRWDRDGDGIPEHRPADGVRGLGSYNEDRLGRGSMAGGDLVALQYAAFRSYARLMEWRGNAGEASVFQERARALKARYNTEWWDGSRGRFHGLRLHDGSFSDDSPLEAHVLPLLCGLVEDGARIEGALEAMIAAPRPNVEARSYYPAAWYMYGRNEEATAELRALTAPDLPRREYPEVSFSVVGSLVGGLMGVDPDARERVVATLPRLPKERGLGVGGTGSRLRQRHLRPSRRAGPDVLRKHGGPALLLARLPSGKRRLTRDRRRSHAGAHRRRPVDSP